MKTNRISELDLFIDEPSGKVYAMRVKDGKHHQDIDFSNLQKMLGDQAKKFDIPKDRQHFELGPIKHVVVDLAKDLKADLIVVGSHSHHGLERLLGSKANAILHLAQCDVLTVRITE